VQVELGREVSSATVAEMEPDVVIVATGAVPLVANIPGIKNSKVVTAFDVLTGKVILEENVFILGGGMIGAETADFLGQRGKQITIIEMRPEIALDVAMGVKPFLMARLAQYGVKQIMLATVVEITDDGVVYITKEGQQETLRGADNIVLAMGARSVNELSGQLANQVGELYVIGDAKEPRLAYHAIIEGAEVALKI
jgi:pyruvate/2-oxoglutarate dehydrogenase complex dihydrolipoamide dehydrogenase (E3) component